MKPLPTPSNFSREYWDAARAGRLVLQRCARCSSVQMPRPVCASCGANALTWFDASGRGRVLSATVVHQPPSPAFDVPYVLALIQLDEGPVMMANMLAKDVRIDDRVKVTFERRGDVAVPQFVPDAR